MQGDTGALRRTCSVHEEHCCGLSSGAVFRHAIPPSAFLTAAVL